MCALWMKDKADGNSVTIINITALWNNSQLFTCDKC